MATINAYLNFNGNCEQAFSFCKSIFGGEFLYLGRFKDMPAMSDFKVPGGDLEKITHVALSDIWKITTPEPEY
jgi:PhnB protein